MYITVVGGGNSTPIFATMAKLFGGHQVAILTRRPDDWGEGEKKEIGFVNEDPTYLDGEKEFKCVPDLITSDPAACIPQSDMIFIAGIPIHFNREVLERLKEHLQLQREKPIFIGTICAYGGFNWVAADVLGKGNYVLFGTQQIPWTCGTIDYGKKGVVFGQKANMRVATEDGKDPHDIKKMMKDILKIESIKDSDFLVSTLWPNNPSVHPPILYGLFKDWDYKNGQLYEFKSAEAPEMIYAEINDVSADYVDKLNKEQVAIVKALSEVFPENEHLKDEGFDYMKSLLFAYGEEGVEDKSSIKNAIQSTIAYKKHKNPYVFIDESPKKSKTENGEAQKKQMVKPNVDHKFFTTDLPYGLCTYKDIAKMLDVKTPIIDEIIYWNQKLINKEFLVDDEFTGKDIAEAILPSKFGLTKDTLNKGNRE